MAEHRRYRRLAQSVLVLLPLWVRPTVPRYAAASPTIALRLAKRRGGARLSAAPANAGPRILYNFERSASARCWAASLVDVLLRTGVGMIVGMQIPEESFVKLEIRQEKVKIIVLKHFKSKHFLLAEH